MICLAVVKIGATDVRKLFCLLHPCQNDAVCELASNTFGYICHCKPTYSGDKCQCKLLTEWNCEEFKVVIMRTH
jgi:EGF-like domain